MPAPEHLRPTPLPPLPAIRPGEDAVEPSGDSTGNEAVDNAVSFNMELDDYEPQKDEYNFYFTYKVIHPWWDAVGMGLEDAAAQYAERGITINYEYVAPVSPDATDQVMRLEEAAGRGFDVIGVDVADIEVVTPTINNLIDQGIKVMTFSSSDATKEDGCQRIAYVGNTHNYQDGADLTEALCEKLGYEGQVAILVGTHGAPCHEDRAQGAQDVLAQYPNMEVVDIQYDNDSVENAPYSDGRLPEAVSRSGRHYLLQYEQSRGRGSGCRGRGPGGPDHHRRYGSR